MDPRLALVREFYRGLPADPVKVETDRHGFAFLDSLLEGGAALEYGELTPAGSLHKYKLKSVPEARWEALLLAHLRKECNVCLYFAAGSNPLFCFNLDNNHKENNTALIPEIGQAIRALRAQLEALGCPPLILASGRGYHAWCRLEGPVANERLHRFMLRCAVLAVAEVHRQGGDYHRVKFNFYPEIRTHNVVSLRLFGSAHAKNKVFSRVLGPESLLDEEASWAAFEHHLRHRTIRVAAFDQACAALEEKFPPPKG